MPILQIVASVNVPPGSKGKAVLTRVDGSVKTTELPVDESLGVWRRQEDRALGAGLDGSRWRSRWIRPWTVNGHGDLRIRLAAKTLRAGITQAKLTWSFPADASLLLKQSDVMKYAPTVTAPDWFAYQPTADVGKSAIGAEDWLDKPAGKHGGVRLRGDRFVFEDGTPIRFWGTNLSYGASAPPKADADFTAARFAKFGVNAVRMHKFTGPGWEGIGDENDLDPDEAGRAGSPGLLRQPARQERRVLWLVAFVSVQDPARRPCAVFPGLMN